MRTVSSVSNGRLSHQPVPVGAIALLLVLSSVALAAEEGDVPKFDGLRTPTSPAFTLLGVAPTAVERPGSLEDFAVSAGNRSTGFTQLPREFALEAAPYWLSDASLNLTWKSDAAPSVLESIMRSFALSAASATSENAGVSSTSIAGGFRTVLYTPALTTAQQSTLSEIANTLAESARRDLERNQAVLAALEKTYASAIASAAQRRDTAEVRRLTNEVSAAVSLIARADIGRPEAKREREEIAKQIADRLADRDGPWIEVAGAAMWSGDTAVAKHTKFAKWGVWSTAGYRAGSASFVAVVRYLLGVRASEPDFMDLGFRAIATRNRYAISAEYVARHPRKIPAPEVLWRFVGNFDYQVQKDLWVTGSFGRDFEDEAAESLIARLGLSWQFSRSRYVKSLDTTGQ